MPDYREYLQKKLKWTDRDCENVNWISLKLAIRKFERNDQQRLQKFLHDWLPLRASPHMSQPASDCSCPVCHQDDEDLWHSRVPTPGSTPSVPTDACSTTGPPSPPPR